MKEKWPLPSNKILFLIGVFLGIYSLSFVGALIFSDESISIRVARFLTVAVYSGLAYVIYKKNNRILILIMALLIFLSGVNSIVVAAVGMKMTAFDNFPLKIIYILLGSYFVFSAVWLTLLSFKSDQKS